MLSVITGLVKTAGSNLGIEGLVKTSESFVKGFNDSLKDKDPLKPTIETAISIQNIKKILKEDNELLKKDDILRKKYAEMVEKFLDLDKFVVDFCTSGLGDLKKMNAKIGLALKMYKDNDEKLFEYTLQTQEKLIKFSNNDDLGKMAKDALELQKVCDLFKKEVDAAYERVKKLEREERAKMSWFEKAMDWVTKGINLVKGVCESVAKFVANPIGEVSKYIGIIKQYGVDGAIGTFIGRGSSKEELKLAADNLKARAEFIEKYSKEILAATTNIQTIKTDSVEIQKSLDSLIDGYGRLLKVTTG